MASDLAVEGASVVIAGAEIDTSNLMRPWRSRVFRSDDGGLSFIPIHGPLGEEAAADAVEAVTFRGDTVLIARGNAVLRREGDVWSSVDVGVKLLSLAWLEGPRVLGLGEGGAARLSNDAGRTWQPVSTGTNVNLTGMYWRGRTGWAWGTDIDVVRGLPGEPDSREVRAGVLLETVDAGETWAEVHRTQGRVLTTAWFEPGGRAFLATAELTRDEGPAARLELLRSDDGGAQWRAMALPLEVGAIRVPIFGTEAIETSYVHALAAEGATIRLAATAHVNDATTSDSGGGTSTTQRVSDFRIVEYISYDDGLSWEADDLGEIEVSFTGGGGSGDGEMVAGRMGHLHEGLLLARDGRLWQLRTPCADESTCLGTTTCEGGVCVPGEARGEGDGGAAGPGGAGAGGDGVRHGGEGEDESSGCAQSGGGPAPLGSALLLLWGGLLLRRGMACMQGARCE